MKRRFVLAWFVVLLLHLVCVVYYTGFAVAYWKLPTSNLAFRFRTYSIGIDESEYRKIAAIHITIATAHALGVALILCGSLQRRRLAFYPRRGRVWTRARATLSKLGRRVAPVNMVEEVSRKPSLIKISQFFSSTRDRVGTAIFSREGLLGVEFMYFDHLLLARELVETSLQSYQAYRMTHLLSRPWLVRSYIMLLILNCWAMPVLHRTYSKRDRTRRMMSVICDVVLDVVSSIGISFVIFSTYVTQYTDPRFGFPSINWFDDKWFVSVVQEFQLLVVVSWGDVATRIVFALGLLQSLECLKEMVNSVIRPSEDARPSTGPSRTMVVVSERPGPADTHTRPTIANLTTSSWTSRVLRFVYHVAGPTLFMLWGIVILGIQVYAEVRHIDRPCRLPLRPWLSSKPACSLVEIDCHGLNASGSIDSLNEAWTVFDPALTAGLLVRHCPKLAVPPSLHLFTGITSMKVYNATIVAWPDEAGLTAAAHGRLRAVYLVRTNFTRGVLPSGLQRSDFPQTMGSIFVSATDLSTLPANLHTVWPKRMTISIEIARLTTVPEVLMRLSPGLLSLMRNPIRSLSAPLFEIPTLRNLFVSYTAIQELPRNVSHLGASLYALFVEGTNVSTFWSWVDPIVTRSLSYRKGLFNAYGTPYCRERDQILNGTRQRFSGATGNDTRNLATIMDVSTPDRLAYVATAVGCASEFKTLFPLPIQDASSAIR